MSETCVFDREVECTKKQTPISLEQCLTCIFQQWEQAMKALWDFLESKGIKIPLEDAKFYILYQKDIKRIEQTLRNYLKDFHMYRK